MIDLVFYVATSYNYVLQRFVLADTVFVFNLLAISVLLDFYDLLLIKFILYIYVYICIYF